MDVSATLRCRSLARPSGVLWSIGVRLSQPNRPRNRAGNTAAAPTNQAGAGRGEALSLAWAPPK